MIRSVHNAKMSHVHTGELVRPVADAVDALGQVDASTTATERSTFFGAQVPCGPAGMDYSNGNREGKWDQGMVQTPSKMLGRRV